MLLKGLENGTTPLENSLALPDKINLFLGCLGCAGNVITGTSCLLCFALLHLADTEVFNKLKVFGIAGLSGDGWRF